MGNKQEFIKNDLKQDAVIPNFEIVRKTTKI